MEIPQLPVVPIEIVEVVDLAVNAEPAMSLESLDIEDSSTITSHHFTRMSAINKNCPLFTDWKITCLNNINLKTGKIRKRAIHHYLLINLVPSLHKNLCISILFTMRMEQIFVTDFTKTITSTNFFCALLRRNNAVSSIFDKCNNCVFFGSFYTNEILFYNIAFGVKSTTTWKFLKRIGSKYQISLILICVNG